MATQTMCPEEDSASVEWARQKDENWVNKDITSLEFVENIFRLMNWNRECRYKVLGRVANSDQGLCMLFDLEEAIMFTPKPQEYTDPLTGEMKKKQMKFFPDAYKNRIGKSYNDYIADHQMNMFEDFIGYQSSTVFDGPEREAGTTSIPIPKREESENIKEKNYMYHMICWLFLLVSDLERLIREKARVCEYVAVLTAEFAHYPKCCQYWSIRSEVHYSNLRNSGMCRTAHLSER